MTKATDMPSRVGDYDVLEKLGGGRSGPIYKARHRERGAIVSLKVLPPEVVKSPEVIKRFRREAEISAKLDHPSLIVAYESGQEGGLHYLAMEYVQGNDLARLVEQQGRLSVEKALEYLVQAARGLEYLHGQGVYHRNIKPQNLMIDSRGGLKIANLLLARLDDDSDLLAEDAENLTKTGQMMGSAEYLSPEQASDSSRADQRADIYALGCTLHFLLIGKPPYTNKSSLQTILAHRSSPIPSLRALRDDVPEDLDRVFQKMMAKDPAERYQSASAVLAALEPRGLPTWIWLVIPAAVVVLALLAFAILWR